MHLPSMLQQVTALMTTVRKASEVALELKFDPKLENVILLGDDMIIKQVLVNLIGNAIKYTPKGFIRVAAEIVSASAQNCSVLFSVEGIVSDHLHLTFHQTVALVYQKKITKKYFNGITNSLQARQLQLINLMDWAWACQL